MEQTTEINYEDPKNVKFNLKTLKQETVYPKSVNWSEYFFPTKFVEFDPDVVYLSVLSQDYVDDYNKIIKLINKNSKFPTFFIKYNNKRIVHIAIFFIIMVVEFLFPLFKPEWETKWYYLVYYLVSFVIYIVGLFSLIEHKEKLLNKYLDELYKEVVSFNMQFFRKQQIKSPNGKKWYFLKLEVPQEELIAFDLLLFGFLGRIKLVLQIQSFDRMK